MDNVSRERVRAESKYATYKWANAISVTDGYVTFKETDELDDAVVIRRQDLFASPCLATYASMIAMVANNITDEEQAKELMAIADYFEDQAKLAAEEGYKLPDR
jgi:hypothetical protein